MFLLIKTTGVCNGDSVYFRNAKIVIVTLKRLNFTRNIIDSVRTAQ